jgi:hypothetical protein
MHGTYNVKFRLTWFRKCSYAVSGRRQTAWSEGHILRPLIKFLLIKAQPCSATPMKSDFQGNLTSKIHKYTRYLLFWNAPRHWLVDSYRRFGTTHQSHFQCSSNRRGISSWTVWSLKMGLRGCPKISVTTYQSKMHNIPEGRRYNLHRGGCLKSRMLHKYMLIIKKILRACK